MVTHPHEASCIAMVMPDSLLRLGVATTLTRLGLYLHQNDHFDPLECTPCLFVVEPVHLAECTLLYPTIPTLTVSLFESAVVATPSTSPETVLVRVRKLLSAQADAHKRVLSPREQEILTLVAAGRTTQEIAHECFVSKEAVKTHLTRIYRKLGVHNRASAVTCAARSGVLVL
jgi:DNA-binding CsgD family transcriptional regulator